MPEARGPRLLPRPHAAEAREGPSGAASAASFLSMPPAPMEVPSAEAMAAGTAPPGLAASSAALPPFAWREAVPPGQAIPAVLPPEEAPAPIAFPSPALAIPAGPSAAAGLATAAPPAPAPRAAQALPQIVLRAAQAAREGVETISVDLRPPELGRVELQLTFRDGGVQVVLRAEQPETFEALRQERHSLVQQMEQAGIQLGGGGLDLQQGRLPRPEPEPVPLAPPAAEAEEAGPAAGGTDTRPRRLASDSLIDITA